MATIIPTFDSINLSGIVIYSDGVNVIISGLKVNNLSDKQILFNINGITTGDSNFKWYTGANGSQSLNIGQAVILPTNPLAIAGSGDTYIQTNIQNLSSGLHAQSDYVLTADIGTDTSNFVDLGINNTMFADTGYQLYKPLDGFLYNRGGDMFLGSAVPGNAVGINAGGLNSGNLIAVFNYTGVIVQTGRNLRILGAGTNQTGDLLLTPTAIQVGLSTFSGVGIAGKPGISVTTTGWGTTHLQPAFYQNRTKFFGPNNAATQSIWGDTAANVGTLANTIDQVLGDFTKITPAVGLSAGLSATNANIFRGTVLGANGFFFSCKFSLNTVWSSGRATSSYAEPSGSRIFVGLTDQSVANQVGLNEPVGNMVGLNFMWASGGAVGTGQYMQNWAIRTRDNTATSTGNTLMSFYTGYYRFSMYCPPFPNNSIVNWELLDLLRNSGVQGQVTANLPVGSTALRPMAALGWVSGINTIGVSSLYIEKFSSIAD